MAEPGVGLVVRVEAWDPKVLSLSPVGCWINTRGLTQPVILPRSAKWVPLYWSRCTISLCVVRGNQGWRQEGHPAIKHCLKKGTMIAWSPQIVNPCSAGKNGCKKAVVFGIFNLTALPMVQESQVKIPWKYYVNLFIIYSCPCYSSKVHWCLLISKSCMQFVYKLHRFGLACLML